MKRSAITRLSERSFRANRSRNLIATVAIIMTAVMFTAVFTVGFSMVQSMAALGAGGGAQGALAFVMATLLILVSGYLIIFNIFQISVSQDVRFYGILKTLGATKRQVGRIFVSQAMKLWLIGTPIGLLAGYGIGAVVMPVALVSLGSAASLSMNPLIFLAGALFTLITVLISCASPARASGRIAPAAALRYADGDALCGMKSPKGRMVRTARKAKRRKVRKVKPGRAGCRAGFRGNIVRSMASENLKRNKKRTADVVISIALGFMLMNSLYVMQHSYDKETYVNNFIQSDIAISTGAIDQATYGGGVPEASASGGVTQDMIEDITAQPGVTGWGAVYYTEQREKLNEDVLSRMTTYYDEEDSGQAWWLEEDEDAARQYTGVKQSGETVVSVYGIDGFTAPMGRYFAGEYDERKFATGSYVIAFGLADNGWGSVHYEVGDEIVVGGRTYELMAVMEPAETLKGRFHSKNNALEIDYAIHTSAFRDSFPGESASSLFLDAGDAESRDSTAGYAGQQYPGATVVTTLSYEASFNSQVMAQVVMGYTLGFVMALIGILNFVNAMLTAIASRKREFAMLESVGMTKVQLKKMLVGEGMNYAALSLVIGLILSVFAALTVVQETISTSWAAAFDFSLDPFGVVVPVMLALAVLIPLVCFRNTQKKSLSERLRETAF